jgi:hypothetical protein
MLTKACVIAGATILLMMVFHAQAQEAKYGAAAAAGDAWVNCTDHAVDEFADQPEPASTVADAAMALCHTEEFKYIAAFLVAGIPAPADQVDGLERDRRRDLTARTMAIRAVKRGHF